MKRLRWLALVGALALVVAACSPSSSDGTSTTAGDTTQTTAASGDTTTTVAAGTPFEGLVLDSGGCDYGGKVNTITAVDEHTVEFALCSPDPAFLAKIKSIITPDGCVAYWLAEPAPKFKKLLIKAGFQIEEYAAKPHEKSKRARHCIYVATRRQ